VLLALTQLTNWKFLHPMQVRHWRPLTITVTIGWLAVVLAMTADLPSHEVAGDYLLIACPLYIVGVGVWRTLSGGTLIDEHDRVLPATIG
ncbi:MAG: hypothetical protein HY826_14305, partial [Actinobacteria bacterium]|nr:hypothetical protein [Actinomycetota bacterium]